MNVLVGPVGLIISLIAIASMVTAMLSRTYRMDPAPAGADAAGSAVGQRIVRVVARAWFPLAIITVAIIIARVIVIA